MKGEVSISIPGNEVSSTLPLMADQQTNEVAQCITNILQDINQYMKLNGGAAQLGELRKTTLVLGNIGHEVRIVVGTDNIKAVVRPIGGTQKE